MSLTMPIVLHQSLSRIDLSLLLLAVELKTLIGECIWLSGQELMPWTRSQSGTPAPLLNKTFKMESKKLESPLEFLAKKEIDQISKETSISDSEEMKISGWKYFLREFKRKVKWIEGYATTLNSQTSSSLMTLMISSSRNNTRKNLSTELWD